MIRHLAVQGGPRQRTHRSGTHRHRDRADKQGQDKHPEDPPSNMARVVKSVKSTEEEENMPLWLPFQVFKGPNPHAELGPGEVMMAEAWQSAAPLPGTGRQSLH